MPGHPPPLLIERFTKRYGSLVAVDNFDLQLNPGEVFGLLGPNGAGKTTIISTIVSLNKPTSGSLRIFGHDIQQEPAQAKQQLGFVPQELIHHGFFTVAEVMDYHASFFGLRHPQVAIRQLLQRLELWKERHKRVNQLSGGMKRRLLIAKALIHKPRLLLLDEPTAGVDVGLRSLIWKFIQHLREENLSILLTTHYLEEAERLCDRIGILDRGRLKQVDSTESMLAQHSLKQVTLMLHRPLDKLSHPYLDMQSDYFLDFSVPNQMPLHQIIRETSIPFDAIADVNIKSGGLEAVMSNLLSGD